MKKIITIYILLKTKALLSEGLFLLFVFFIATNTANAQQDVTYQWAKSIGSTNPSSDDSGKSIAVDSIGNVYITGSFRETADFDPGTGTANLTSTGFSDIFFAKYDNAGNYIWAKNIGSAGVCGGRDIALDDNGNIHITGTLDGTADFDPGAGTANLVSVAGSRDIFFAKYDNNGNYIWAKNIGNTADNYSKSIDVDTFGNVYLTGLYHSTLDFDPGSGTANLLFAGGFNDAFFAKYDSNGNYIWAKSIGSAGLDGCFSLALDSLGNVYITGMITNTADFDPGTGTANLTGTKTFFAKYDSNGNYIWAKTIGGATGVLNDYGYGIVLDDLGNIYLTGYFYGTADFDPGVSTVNLVSAGICDIFFAKYSNSGSYIWAKRIGSTGGDIGGDIEVDSLGGIYITGSFEGTADFDPGAGTSNLIAAGSDIFFAKYDTNGNYYWAKNIHGNSNNVNSSIAVDGNENVYITGYYGSTCDFDPGAGTANLTSAGASDIFFAHYFNCSANPVLATASSSYVTCNGGSNGTATVFPTGGTPPYLYSWNTFPIQTADNAGSLIAGNYTVTITDSKNCVKTLTVNVNQPAAISISTIQTYASCLGGTDGTATATVIGGIPPYLYSWNTSPIQTAATAINLPVGNYVVTITDSIGCAPTANVTIINPPISAGTSSTPNTKCTPCDGTASVNSTSGGASPYLYQWDSFSNNQTTTTATGLCSGIYSVTITDANGCTTSKNVQVVDQLPPGLFASPSSTINTKCSGSCMGSSTLNVSGGTAPYTYLWSSEANNQTTETATSLCQGIYSVVITDMNGCTIQENITIAVNTVADPNIYLTNLAAVDQINISPSFAAFYTYNLPASISAPPSNPRNFVDPGKKARFKVECTNQKMNGQSIVSGICKVRSNNPYITITDSSSALNNIGWNDKAWSADEFEVNIDPNTPPGTNAYIDFIVQESGQEYSTTCIAIPITPLVYSAVTPFTIDDDNNPDSQGNDNDICDANEIIEFYPWLDNISTLDAEFVRGRLENLDNHSYINIWNGVPGINTTVYDAGWWNYSFAQPQTVASNSFNTTPEYDFVFNYNNTNIINNFKLYMVMAGGFKLFSGNALSLVQWTLPYTFAATGSTSIGSEIENTDGLSLYPNPSNGNVQIQINNGRIQHINIYNPIGALIYQSEKETLELNLTGYPKGVYLIQVQSTGKTINKRIVIQ